jgi:hypothetical protein
VVPIVRPSSFSSGGGVQEARRRRESRRGVRTGTFREEEREESRLWGWDKGILHRSGT